MIKLNGINWHMLNALELFHNSCEAGILACLSCWTGMPAPRFKPLLAFF